MDSIKKITMIVVCATLMLLDIVLIVSMFDATKSDPSAHSKQSQVCLNLELKNLEDTELQLDSTS